jgi:glucose/arabinose dehydrogenase
VTDTHPTAVLPTRVVAVVAVVTLGLLGAACTIQTQTEDLTAATTAPPTTEAVVGTTVPPELRPPGVEDVQVALSEIARYTVELTTVATKPGSDSVFVGSRTGGIYEIRRDARRNLERGTISYTVRPQTSAYLNLSGQVRTEEGADWGLHGFAFSTDGARLYVSFTDAEARTIVAELRVSGGRVSPGSQRTLLEIEHPDRFNNAGPIAMGSDGFLHIPLGDSGIAGDPFDNGQDPTTLAGSVLRIDPETGGENPYNLPLGNPWRGSDEGADEVYFIGLRDPAALWFDPTTGDAWLLDHGEDGRQEVNHLRWRGSPWRSANFGWPIMNGTEPFEGDEPPEGHVAPIFEYGPGTELPFGCEVVGGATYRAGGIVGLDGAYVFGDRCTGALFALQVEDGEITERATLPAAVPEGTLSAIGSTPDGEIIVLTNTGVVFQLVQA